jgi:hypothetical protein
MLPGGIKLDAAQFLAPDAVVVTMNASALAAATSLTVVALTGAIPSGTILDFGTNKLAILTAAAAAGDTTLTVRAIPTAMAGTETATYAGVEIKTVPSGTLVGRTFTERGTNTPFGPAVNTDDEVYLLPFDVENLSNIDDAEALLPGSFPVKENFLPGWTDLASTLKTVIRSKYATTTGVA